MRGGTSKALFLRESDLPVDQKKKDQLILSLFGSPDKRQIDGLGGADPLTSKLAIIGPSNRLEADISYTFAQVGIEESVVDYRSLCGNISAAVGHYAVFEGLVPIMTPITTVCVFNKNLNRILRIEVPVNDQKPLEEGDYITPGVPGSGAKITLDLRHTAGGTTGRLLPTGSPIDMLNVSGVGEIEASIVDVGNAHVFVRAEDLGLTGIETPSEIDQNSKLTEYLESIRATAAYRIGMIDDPKQSKKKSPATPIIGFVAPPKSYRTYLNNIRISTDEIDLVSRLMYMQITHKTYAGTSTVCTGVAARIKGTIVHEVSSGRDNIRLRIGHPAGVIETESIVEQISSEYVVKRATIGRTARRLMEGYSFIHSSI